MWYNKSNSLFLASSIISKVIVSNTTNFPTIPHEKRIQVKSGMLKYFWVKRRNLKKKDILQSKETCDTDIRMRQFLYKN